MDPITYASAGVNIEKAESFVSRLKARSKRAGHEKLWRGAGGYASVYPVNNESAIAVTTDGVGTKLLVANELSDHSTIGIDLVAMCANDLICVGATPTIFLDYFAIGKLEDEIADAIIGGIVEGCDQGAMILAGGETAEMPGVYDHGHYDLAGFAVGQVTKETLLTGENIRPGQKLIGVASSGVHSNGLSLARKVLDPKSEQYRLLLKPTKIYVQPALEAMKRYPTAIVGMAHITGGGWRNLFRLNDKVGFEVKKPLAVPEVLAAIGRKVPTEEMYKTFNMGMGLALIADNYAEAIADVFNELGFTAQVIGEVTDKASTLHHQPLNLTIKD